jgi:hypothetical protein
MEDIMNPFKAEAELSNLTDKLAHALTAYDIKQSKRKGYNVYALAQYLGRVNDPASCSLTKPCRN